MRFIQGRNSPRGDHWVAEEGETLTNEQLARMATYHPSLRRAIRRYQLDIILAKEDTFEHPDTPLRVSNLRLNLMRAEAEAGMDRDVNFLSNFLHESFLKNILQSYFSYREIALHPNRHRHAHMYYMHLNLLLLLMVHYNVDMQLRPLFSSS